MKSFYVKSLAAVISLGVSGVVLAQPQTISAAITRGHTSGSFNLRYESVDENSTTLKNADALTLRSALKYTTGTLDGFTGVAEFEDVRQVGGMDHYSVPQTGQKTGQYSVIADPETTEVTQGYLQYVDGRFMARFGRQDIRFDNQRFVGAVPWRQDWQNFDALSLQYKNEAALTVDYNYLGKRNRVFAQAADVDSKDHLLHLIYPTAIGTLTGYAYLLKEDIVLHNKLDTYGVRLNGAKRLGSVDTTYLVEYATQKSERGTASFDADYYVAEVGGTFTGVTAKLGLESLGSDKGLYGFSTPLATLHLYQGWADQFLTTPNQGIVDTYISVGTPIAGGAFTIVYHDFSADESTPTIDNLGKETDVQWTLPFKNNYTWGIKYADYSKGDIAAKLDKTVFWTWLQMTF